MVRGVRPAAWLSTALLVASTSTATAGTADRRPRLRHGDELPDVRVLPATFAEPTFGRRLGFTVVRLSAPSPHRVVVEITSRNGTAKAGQDFVPTHPTVVFAPGETTATVSVEILADRRNEPTETLRLKITRVRHAVAQRGGRIRITDAPGG